MKTKIFLLSCLFASVLGFSQGVGIGTKTPVASAALDVSSVTKGFVAPRLTTVQRDAIASPAEGLMIYNITNKTYEWFDGFVWYNPKVLAGTGVSGVGNAEFSSVDCNIGFAGVFAVGIPLSGVTQTIRVNVTKLGTYFFTTQEISGLTYTASGTFVGLGSNDVVLVGSGITSVYDDFVFSLATTPNCSFTRTTKLDPGTVLALDGRIWYTYNLGATAAAASSTDSSQYGDLYQWGRAKDGHQLRTSATTGTLVSSVNPGHNKFIFSIAGANFDWLSPRDNGLWQGVSGVNNPCPSGYRLPTYSEWSAVISAEGITNVATGYSSRLKLVVAGFRRSSNGSLNEVGTGGYYWSSTVVGTFYSNSTGINGSGVGAGYNSDRAAGFSVRCLKN
jgi:uncharacterized protein (TIGR02145 family)